MFIKSYYIDILGINVCIMASVYASWHQCMHHGINVCIMASMYASWHQCMHHGINVCRFSSFRTT